MWCQNCNRNVRVVEITGTSDSCCQRCGDTITRHFEIEPASEKTADKKLRVDAGHRKTQPRQKAAKPAWDPSAQSTSSSGNSSAQKPTNGTRSDRAGGDVQHKNMASNRDHAKRSLYRAARNNFIEESSSDLNSVRSSQPLKLSVYGILLFLIGQTLMTWSFFGGHFVAWTIGNLAFITGLFMCLWNHTSNLTRMQKHMNIYKSNLIKLRESVANRALEKNRNLNAEPAHSEAPLDERIVVKSKSRKRPAGTKV